MEPKAPLKQKAQLRSIVLDHHHRPHLFEMEGGGMRERQGKCSTDRQTDRLHACHCPNNKLGRNGPHTSLDESEGGPPPMQVR